MTSGFEGLVPQDTDHGDIVVVAGDEHVADTQIAAMVEHLRADPGLDAVAWTEPVTDAVKEIGPDGVVRAAIDRSRLVSLRPPMVVRRTAWEADRIDRVAPM